MSRPFLSRKKAAGIIQELKFDPPEATSLACVTIPIQIKFVTFILPTSRLLLLTMERAVLGALKPC